MTPTELKAARHTLGLTAHQLGALIGVKQRMIYFMEYDGPDEKLRRKISPVTKCAVGGFLSGYRPPDWPATS